MIVYAARLFEEEAVLFIHKPAGWWFRKKDGVTVSLTITVIQLVGEISFGN